MSHRLHVGRGVNRGPLTVFPIWAEVNYPVVYSMDLSLAQIQERADGPTVNSVTVRNTATAVA